MSTHLLNRRIYNINIENMSLKLYSTCISNFFHSATLEIIKIREISAKFCRNFEPICTSMPATNCIVVDWLGGIWLEELKFNMYCSIFITIA
jgi:hypothetical protein